MNPRISIVTITYNSEKTLEGTIKSIISQNYDNIEYLIIDGGSKDGTLEIVKRYQDYISYFVSEPDKGISDAFNKGVGQATGEIVGIINSDDFLMPNALQAIAQSYKPDVDVYSGNVIFWNEKTNDKFSVKPDVSFEKLKIQFGVAHPGRFIRKDAYEKYGMYDISCRYMMDVELLCRFYKSGARFAHIDKDLAKFRMGGTTSDSIFRKKEEFKKIVFLYGESKYVFRILWIKKILKYFLVKLCTYLFGEGFRFTYYKVLNKVS